MSRSPLARSRLAIATWPSAHACPRRLWHRVSKCKSGLRQSIVFWVRHNCKAPESRFEGPEEEEEEEPEEKEEGEGEETEEEDSPSKAA